MIRVFNILLLLSFSSCLFQAYTQSLSDTLQIKEVSVCRSEFTASEVLHESVIDTLAMKQSMHHDLSRLLSEHSTVYVKSTGNGLLSTASFRGTDPGHTKVFWNGIRLNSPMLGQVDLSMVPVCFADRILLLHGSSSLTKTSGALGGTISLQGIPDWDQDNKLKVNQEIGSFHSYRATSEINLRKSSFLSTTRLYYNRSENDFRFMNTGILPAEESRMKNAGFLKMGFNQDAYYRVNEKNQVSAHLWFQDAGRNLPQPMSYEGDGREEKQTDRQFYSSLAWKSYQEKSNLEVRSGITWSKLNYHYAFPVSGYVNIDSRSRETGFNNKIKLDHELNQKTELITEVSHVYNTVSVNERVRLEGYDANRSELSLMMMVNRDLSERIKGWILLREDLVDASLIPLMPSLGMSYKLLENNDLYLKANLSRNYNIPSLNDLYWIPGGNPGLRPEMSYTGDLSAITKYSWKNIELSSELTGFVSRINDWILWKPTRFQYWTAENIASVFSRGMEAVISSAITANDIKIQLNANYSLTFTTNQQKSSMADQSHGKQLIYIPRHVMNAHAWFDYKGFSVNYSFIFVGKRYAQTSNEENYFDALLNPYSLNHIMLGKELNFWKLSTTLQFGVYNLFNTSYQVILSRPMPGRYYSVNLGVAL